MAKLVMMRGLPASGKSTLAAEYVKQGGWMRVNRDLLREMLHFNAFSGKNEGLTVQAEKNLVRHFLEAGMSVVVDDCNLGEKHAQMWMALALDTNSKFGIHNVKTHWKECVERDTKREKSVGRQVIAQMALQYSLLYENEVPRSVVVCDIDGTIANIDHRLHHVQKEPKDWKSFFSEMSKDTVREDVKKMLRDLEDEGHEICFVSARPDTYRKETEDWLLENIGHNFVLMRRAGDKRPDTMVKKDIYDTYLKHYRIHCVIDDRPSVLRMWEEQGLRTIDVGKGIEF